MKITFLGTGAADWSFEKDREKEDFRRFSSILIDDVLLIDPGPHVPDAIKTFGIEPNKIRYIINTHRHSDHYNENTLKTLKFAEFHDLKEGTATNIGEYKVFALKANHSTCKEAVHFIISDGEKNIFYGLDGAWLMYEEVEAIKAKGIDLAVLDATVGDIYGDYRIFEHNNLGMVREIKKSLEGSIKRFCISHMAKTLHEPHSKLAENMKQYGIETAYDGYETNI